VYRDFGFTNILYKIATRPEKRIGSDDLWDKAEAALMESLKRSGCEFEVTPGEGAFYGPKIEYTLKDAIGRHWQCGTIQVDFSMPGRLGATYIAEDGSKQVPVMLHRAILGSLERFIGILIEQYSGTFPVWLSPVQVMVLDIADRHAEYASRIMRELEQQGVRVKIDLRNEKIGFKIREHSMQRIPYLVIIGDKELEDQNITVRMQKGEDLGSLSISEFTERLKQEIADRK
jgi:threonyl-tRNA synthetase